MIIPMRLPISFLLSVICTTTAASPVQEKKRTVPAATVTASALTRYTPDLLTRDRIDPKFVGANVVALAKTVEKYQTVSKDEFESSEKFAARQAKARGVKLTDGSSIDDTFAFVVPVAKLSSFSNGLRYSYDADTATVSLYILPASHAFNGIGGPGVGVALPQIDTLTLKEVIDSDGKYEGSNAYGATVTVEKTRWSEYGLAMSKIAFVKRPSETYYRTPEPTVRLPMVPAIASIDLPALKAVIVAKLSLPELLYDFSSIKPTRDKPQDMITRKKYLNAEIVSIVFYSGVSGKVLARQPETVGAD